jgi:hypothetical protein
VAQALRDQVEVVVLAANSSTELLAEQARTFQCRNLVLSDRSSRNAMEKESLPAGCKVSYGPEALVEAACREDVDMVLCAIVGTTLSFRKMKSHSYLETACYVLMGLTILVAFKPFHDSVGTTIVLWVVAEGVSYILGAVLYGFKKVCYMHSVFHGFVLLGDVFHMIALYKILNMFLVA